MNSENLIRLGSLCQRLFNLPISYEVMFMPEDSPNAVRVAGKANLSVPKPDFNRPAVNYFAYLEQNIQTVELEKVGITYNQDYAWVGYADQANILIIKEVKK